VKDFVISVNNLVLYVSLAVIWIFSFVAIFTSGFFPALGIFVVGTLVWCIVSGFWFVQSATYEELRKLNANKG
jgi:polyferredoxin